MMMKKYLAAAVFASSLLAAPAFAQTATSCDAMLKDFDNHLTSNNIQPTDARVTQARTQAEQACMSGDTTTAESTLDRAVADLGIPPRTGKAAGGNTGATEFWQHVFARDRLEQRERIWCERDESVRNPEFEQ